MHAIMGSGADVTGCAPLNRDTTLEFMNALPPVVDRVLSCFAVGLGYPEDKFKQASPGDPSSC